MSWRICPISPLSLPVFKDWMRERESDPKIAWEISISVANMTPLLQRKGLRGFCCVGRREDFIHCSYCFAKTVPDYHHDTRVLTLKKPGGGAFHLVMGGAWEWWSVGLHPCSLELEGILLRSPTPGKGGVRITCHLQTLTLATKKSSIPKRDFFHLLIWNTMKWRISETTHKDLSPIIGPSLPKQRHRGVRSSVFRIPNPTSQRTKGFSPNSFFFPICFNKLPFHLYSFWFKFVTKRKEKK